MKAFSKLIIIFEVMNAGKKDAYCFIAHLVNM